MATKPSPLERISQSILRASSASLQGLTLDQLNQRDRAARQQEIQLAASELQLAKAQGDAKRAAELQRFIDENIEALSGERI